MNAPMRPGGDPDDFLARLRAILADMNRSQELFAEDVKAAQQIQQHITEHAAAYNRFLRRYRFWAFTATLVFSANTLVMLALLIGRAVWNWPPPT